MSEVDTIQKNKIVCKGVEYDVDGPITTEDIDKIASKHNIVEFTVKSGDSSLKMSDFPLTSGTVRLVEYNTADFYCSVRHGDDRLEIVPIRNETTTINITIRDIIGFYFLKYFVCGSFQESKNKLSGIIQDLNANYDRYFNDDDINLPRSDASYLIKSDWCTNLTRNIVKEVIENHTEFISYLSLVRMIALEKPSSSNKIAYSLITNPFTYGNGFTHILMKNLSNLVLKDDDGNEIGKVSIDNERISAEELESLSELIDQHLGQNIGTVESLIDIYDKYMTEISKNEYLRGFNEGKQAAMTFFQKLGKGWRMERNWLIYEGDRICPTKVRRNGVVYEIPDGMKERLWVDKIVIPLGDRITNIVAHGKFPHILDRNRVTDVGEGSVCLGTLGGKKFEGIDEILDLFDTVNLDSPYWRPDWLTSLNYDTLTPINGRVYNSSTRSSNTENGSTVWRRSG